MPSLLAGMQHASQLILREKYDTLQIVTVQSAILCMKVDLLDIFLKRVPAHRRPLRCTCCSWSPNLAAIQAMKPIYWRPSYGSLPVVLSIMLWPLDSVSWQCRELLCAEVATKVRAAILDRLCPGLHRLREAERKAPNAELLQIVRQLSTLACAITDALVSSKRRGLDRCFQI